MGRFADLISPYFAGHSVGVAELASEAAGRCRIDARARRDQRAGLVHDLGRVAVPRVWQKPGPLSADELEQVRLHPYHTERCLALAVPGGTRRSLLPTTSGSTEAATTAARLVPT